MFDFNPSCFPAPAHPVLEQASRLLNNNRALAAPAPEMRFPSLGGLSDRDIHDAEVAMNQALWSQEIVRLYGASTR
jgi:hypothetical protein